MGLIQSKPQRFEVSGEHRRVAIAGFDVEGRATYDYLSKFPGMEITILDEKNVQAPAGAATKTGADVFDSTLDFDVVWRTPGLSPHKLTTQGEVTSGTIEFFARCPATIIGVTGTKGKGTTASLIAGILEESGQTVHLVGNIGRPALSVLDEINPDDAVVYELSSFQLWDLKASPHVAVVLMVEPEHLDVHTDMGDYLKAKGNIVRWQGPDDTTVYSAASELAAKVASAGLGRKIAVPGEEGAEISDGQLMIQGQAICKTSGFGLIGEHNHANIAAALTASWQIVQDKEAAAKAITGFKGLPHRLQLIAQKNGVDFVDDSISTTPSSAIAALRSFEGPKVIILGGSDKGAAFKDLASELASQPEAKAVLIGSTAGKIQTELDKAGFKDYDKVSGGMMEILRQAVSLLGGKGTVLLSPACASFDMFDDYKDRAHKFAQAVKEL